MTAHAKAHVKVFPPSQSRGWRGWRDTRKFTGLGLVTTPTTAGCPDWICAELQTALQAELQREDNHLRVAGWSYIGLLAAVSELELTSGEGHSTPSYLE